MDEELTVAPNVFNHLDNNQQTRPQHKPNPKFRVIKVPEFIAQTWLQSTSIGTQIGLISEPQLTTTNTQPHSAGNRTTHSATQSTTQSASKKHRSTRATANAPSSARASISISTPNCPVKTIYSLPIGLPITNHSNNRNYVSETDPETNDLVIISLASDTQLLGQSPSLVRPRVEGIVSAIQSYLPDAMDPQYLQFLTSRTAAPTVTLEPSSASTAGTLRQPQQSSSASSVIATTPGLKPVLLSVAETNAMQKKFKEFDESNRSESRLFKYFSTEEMDDIDGQSTAVGGNDPFNHDAIGTSATTAASFLSGNQSTDPFHQTHSMGPGVPQPSGPLRFGAGPYGGAPGPSTHHSGMGGGTSLTMSYEEGQEKLFRLFEAKGAEGVNFRDIQQNIKMAPAMLKKLLDQIAEPQRERLGKRTIFLLKSQYKIMK